ncbi:extracellular solute-binding protein [Streptomyces sp. NBC_00237]|uniref:extracellular solute-binding protein n=1 Tax=Streptomyces sp. NBC_00237 TaxID=2975687 RepID=UPI00224D0410|nr:extracellular solute-binding protein [Streptomyces sp. NBC_00237]MCX5203535.1 extracellular solute-binding protein [Streptomyces sp. NBC_00237]
MRNRVIATGAATLVMALGLSACGGDGDGGGGGDDAKGKTIKVVAADYGTSAADASKPFWEKVAKDFEAANAGYKVELQVINWNDIDKTVKTMIAAGNEPDILQTGGYADKVADDLLYKVDDVMSPATKANLSPGFAEAGKVKGAAYGIPWVASTRTFFYNKKAFATAGITKPPTTWAEVADAAKKLKEKKAAEIPYALPLGPEETQGETLMWEMGNGGGYKDDAGKYTLNSAQNVETFKWLQDNLVKPGLTYPNPATTDRKTAFADFAAGKVGMMNGHPSVVKMAEDGKVEYGMASIPGKSGPLDSTLGVGDWTMAFKDGKGSKEAIKKFLDFTYTKDNLVKFSGMYNFIPVTTDAAAAMQADPKNAKLKDFFAALPKAKFYPVSDTSWDVVSAEIKKTGGKAASEDPKAVLDDLQKKAEEAAKTAK